jgi:hypothetical protein
MHTNFVSWFQAFAFKWVNLRRYAAVLITFAVSLAFRATIAEAGATQQLTPPPHILKPPPGDPTLEPET